jgi:hypothetical protein
LNGFDVATVALTKDKVDILFNKGNTYGGGHTWATIGKFEESVGRGLIAVSLMGGTTLSAFTDAGYNTVIRANTAIKNGYNTVVGAYNIPPDYGFAKIQDAEADLADFAKYNSDPFESNGVITTNEKAIIDALFGPDESINGDTTAKALKAAFKTELDLY